MKSFDSYKTPEIDLRKRSQKESVKESIQESKGISFSSQHEPPEPKNPTPVA